MGKEGWDHHGTGASSQQVGTLGPYDVMNGWKSHGSTTEYHGNIMGISWEYHGNIIRISWEYHGDIMDMIGNVINDWQIGNDWE